MRSTPRLTGRPGGLTLTVADGLSNVLTGMGGVGDKRMWSRWELGGARGFGPMRLDPVQVAAAYMTNWIVAKVHDIPAEDMTKAWRNWQATPEQITALEDEEKRLGLQSQAEEAIREGLFGGAAWIMGLPGGSASKAPAPEAVGKGGLRYIWTVSRWALSVEEWDLNLDSPTFGQPKMFILNGQNQARVHPSRVVIWPGKPIPKNPMFLSQQDRFWGAPLLERINSAMQNAETSQVEVANLLYEAKMDVVSIPNLTETVSSPGGEARIIKRLEVSSAMKSQHGAMLLDGGDGTENAPKETWEVRQINFAQLPETIMTFLQVAAGAADIPITRVLQTQMKGLGNGGEAEEQKHNEGISARQNSQLRPRLERVDAYLKASAGVQDTTEKPVTWTFAPLSKPTPKENAEIDKLISEAIKNLADSKVVQPDALNAIVKGVMIERQTWPGAEQAFQDAQEDIPAIREAELSEQTLASANENAAEDRRLAARGATAQATTRRRATDSIEDAEPRSLYVSRKVLNPQEVLNWARSHEIPNLQAAGELHVTVIYSRRAVDWLKLPTDWSGDAQGRLRLPPGGPRLVERFGPEEDVIVLAFNDDHLQWRHRALIEAGAASEWPEYQPHITLAWDVPKTFDISAIPPYQGRIVLGPEIFREVVENWLASK